MPIDSGNMMQKVYDYFNNLYRASSPKSFLVYQTLGLPISPEDIKDKTGAGDAASALEYTSTMVSQPMVIQNNTVTQDGMRHVYDVLATLLNSCMPIDDTAMVALGQTQQAGATSMGITIGSLTGIPDYEIYPVTAHPANWWDPTQANNWSTFPAGATTPPAPPPPPPSPPPAASATPPPHVAINPIAWRVLPVNMRPILARPMMGQTVSIRQMPVAMAGGPAHAALGLATGAVLQRPANLVLPPVRVAPRPAPPVLHPLPPAVATHPALPVHVTPPAPVLRPAPPSIGFLHNMLDNVAIVHANTTPQSVTSSNLSITFQYCIVQLDWPWLPNGFLMQRNWYQQNYDRGEYSNGTGIADPGQLPVIPTGFIAVKDLKISGTWSEADKTAIANSAGLNAINLLHSNFEGNTLSTIGIQIIGWFCSALPVLPPFADPHLLVGQGAHGAAPVAVGAT